MGREKRRERKGAIRCIASKTDRSAVISAHCAKKLRRRPAVLTSLNYDVVTGIESDGDGSWGERHLFGEPSIDEQEPSGFPKSAF